ncbi:MarR family winged helix-turn-helix transcriptional regulator [Nesterenkonia haasae]|uniref:MarR family winged helix-turn-helix transcriptional regulator n=1 Tax=Nesterenkonia haasae TaxID=2587813 RepID=UPI001390CD2B|nr:MarR family transcriptional regulator [Nesterenkonia haasae]NDK32559.1 MarR family transcriptional regulator [Nesterenkonia haasae]
MTEPSDDPQDSPMPGGWYMYMLKLVETGMRPSLEAALSAHSFTTAQYTALSVLRVRPGITSSELARRSFVKAQSMAETVASLQARGLVQRERDPAHARRLLLQLTEHGHSHLKAVERPVAQAEEAVLKGLSESSRSHLATALRTLRLNLQGLGG